MCDTSMDSRNLHQHQQHHQLHENHQLVDESSNNSSSSSLPSSCFSSVADTNDHGWRTPSFFLNSSNIHATCSDEAASNSLNNPIMGVQEMNFPWPNEISLNQSSSHHHGHHHQQLITHKIKDESSPSTPSDHHHHHDTNPKCFAKFSDMLSSSTSPSDDMLLLKNTLSTSYKNHMLSNTRELHHQPSPFQPSMQYHHQNANMGLSTTFSQIFPSVNISNMSNNDNNKLSSPMSSSSSTIDHHMANNMQGGFHLFATARLLSGETSLNYPSAPNNNLLELFKGSPNQFNVDHDLQQSNDLKRCNTNIASNVSSFNNNGGPSESSKNYIMENKSTSQMTTKKQRFESRSSCPPFKVRKEKLGDRIAALQQLVSPFGKTDTASVLMEAIGYIKFLQNQVETLSVPYMKLASCNKSSNSQRVDDEYNSESGDPNITDLKSRGLCLVPTSCMSYINLAAANNDPVNGGVWAPPNFNPGGGF